MDEIKKDKWINPLDEAIEELIKDKNIKVVEIDNDEEIDDEETLEDLEDCDTCYD